MRTATSWFVAMGLLAAGCSKPPAPRVQGRAFVAGAASEPWVAPGGAFVATLKSPAPSSVRGAPADLRLGTLVTRSLADDGERSLGAGVPNVAGAVLFSPDGASLAFLADYDVAKASGRLMLAAAAREAAPVPLAAEVSFAGFSPDGAWLAYVAGGGLHVYRVADGEDRAVASDVSRVVFGPKGTPAAAKFLVKRSIRSDGALLTYDPATSKLEALGHGVGTFGWSPDGLSVAFQAAGLLAPADVQAQSKLGAAHEPRDAAGLYLKSPTGPASLVFREGASEFKFSPDGRRLAFVAAPTAGAAVGDLYVSTGDGAAAKVAGRVSQFVFAESGALVLLGAWDAGAAAGTLGVLPVDGALREVARSVRQFTVSPSGRRLLFVHGVQRGGFALLGLAAWPLDAGADAKAQELDVGVAGYALDDDERRVAWKARCVDGGSTCSLFAADLDSASAPRLLQARVSAFEFLPGREGLVVVQSRSAGKNTGKLLFSLGVVPDVAMQGAKAAPVAVLDDQVSGEFALAGPARRQVVYRVEEVGREGLSVADVP